MRHNIIFEHHAQSDLPPYRRLRAIGHNVGCTCEACFVHVERAILHYLPGLIPPDPLAQRNEELERENAELRKQLDRSAGRPGPHLSHAREPQRPRQDSAAFVPVVLK